MIRAPTPLPAGEALAALVRGEAAVLETAGKSMWPLIGDGDLVEVSGALRPRVGDIVFFVRDGRFVLHRIVEWSGDEARTRGDSETEPDPRVPRSAILGVAVRSWRRGVPIPLRPPAPFGRLACAAASLLPGARRLYRRAARIARASRDR